ncbi:leucine-rich repeat domain-containing protein, partial [Ruminococcus flavefaciens]|uniref:leucine-rich repeat domain-containing protein n=1 Tax=Ruminococcus flavefaciens TaxID=1265 RepID=UPI001A985F38
AIGNNAFSGCSGLTNVTVPETVKTIGEYAFSDCSSLASAVIRGGADGIGSHVFSGCKSLAELTLPFAGFSLEAVNTDGSSQEIVNLFLNGNDDEFYNINNTGGWRRYIPKALKKITILGGGRIPNYAFYRMNGVEEIVVPDDITSLGSYAFYNCTSLKNAVMPNSLLYIGDHAFANCSSADLSTISFPESIETIGEYAFSNCDSLISVTIPESVKTISNYAFEECDSLKTAEITGDNTTIGSHIFSACKSLESLTLPFAGSSLSAVNADGSAQQISELFLNGNDEDYFNINNSGGWRRYIPKSLKTITINGGKKIPKYAFYRMLGVEDVYLPKEITNIADNSFDGCSGIQNVFYPSTRADWEKNVTVG